jgi:hypothetical protein
LPEIQKQEKTESSVVLSHIKELCSNEVISLILVWQNTKSGKKTAVNPSGLTAIFDFNSH